ncbi:hypothetical protein L1987_86042 [Smallanthus sonchifolius]|uniref:Uncharacterized protein n=1 Tax=Smallanthus sonchifolius TaxID=185202 RepID=A0ACB8XY95_9ASTR|nr:hypothetical protein L1987_86042 [Smallanthus sonchifolius]
MAGDIWTTCLKEVVSAWIKFVRYGFGSGLGVIGGVWVAPLAPVLLSWLEEEFAGDGISPQNQIGEVRMMEETTTMVVGGITVLSAVAHLGVIGYRVDNDREREISVDPVSGVPEKDENIVSTPFGIAISSLTTIMLTSLAYKPISF